MTVSFVAWDFHLGFCNFCTPDEVWLAWGLRVNIMFSSVHEEKWVAHVLLWSTSMQKVLKSSHVVHDSCCLVLKMKRGNSKTNRRSCCGWSPKGKTNQSQIASLHRERTLGTCSFTLVCMWIRGVRQSYLAEWNKEQSFFHHVVASQPNSQSFWARTQEAVQCKK